jgi:ATP-binding cassette subfamily C protein
MALAPTAVRNRRRVNLEPIAGTLHYSRALVDNLVSLIQAVQKGWLGLRELPIAERSQRGKLRKAREGKVMAGHRVKYSFKLNTSCDGLLVDEEKMRVVRRIFRMAGDPLDEISRASRVRMRRVALKGDWWRKDSGPLLGFRGEDESPVALLQRGTSAYTLVDPSGGTRQTVTGETASDLAPFGYTFYAPFPDRPLGAWDLLKYSLRDLRGDLLRVLLMGAAAGLLGALVPIVTKQIVDIAIPQAEGGLAVALSLGLVVAAISAMLFEVARQFAVLRIETKLDSGLQAAVWDRLLSLPTPFFRDYSAGDLAVRAMGINTIRQMVTGATISSLLSGVFSVFSLAVIFYYSAELGLIAALMAVIIIGVTAAGGYV